MIAGVRLLSVGLCAVVVTISAACSQGSCSSFNINNCLNTVSDTSGFSGTNFQTNGLSDQITMSCGSKQSGLNDRLFQFSVQTSGLYTLLTTGADTTMELRTCSNNKVVSCNDDIDSNNKNSQLTVALNSATQFVAAVSKHDTNKGEVTFDFSIQPVCLCTAFAPDECLGTVPATGLVKPGLSTSGKANRVTQTCGSLLPNLNQIAIQFSVAQTGVYSVGTQNIDADTTMSLFDCFGIFIGCNDDRAPSDKSSEIQATLIAGISYIAFVSKFDTTFSKADFDFSVQLLTSSPTVTPTASPTSTSAPGFATNSPTTTADNVTSAPTNNGADGFFSKQANVVALGGGVGGGALLVALGLVVRRRSRRRNTWFVGGDNWAPDEEQRFRLIYKTTHDLQYIGSLFPNKTRDEIMGKIRAIRIEERAAKAAKPASFQRAPSPKASMVAGLPFRQNSAIGNSEMSSSSMRQNASFQLRTSMSSDRLKTVVHESVRKISNQIASTSEAASHFFSHLSTSVPPPPGLSASNPMFSPTSPMGSAKRPSTPQPPFPIVGQSIARDSHISLDPSVLPPPPPLPKGF